MSPNKFTYAVLLAAICFLNISCGAIWGGVSYFAATPPFNYSILQIGGSANSGGAPFVDSSGNIYIGGNTADTIGTQYNTHGPSDAFAAKFTSSGTLIWISQIGTTGVKSNTVSGIYVDAGGNVYLAGSTNGTIGGTGFTQLGTHGSYDAVVFKLNLNGVPVWTSQWGAGGVTSTQGNSNIAIDGLGNLYIGGNTTGTVGTQYGIHGAADAFVMQFSPTGAGGFASQYGDAGLSVAGRGLCIDSGTNIYLTGFVNGFFTGALTYGTASTAKNALIVKFNTGGIFNWATNVGGGGVTITQTFGCALDSSANIRAVGTTNTLLGGTMIGTHSTDGLLSTFTQSNGVMSPPVQLGTAYFSSVVVDSKQRSIISGNTSSVLGTLYGTHGISDLLMTVFDANANFTTTYQWGDSANSFLTSAVNIYGQSTFYIAGATAGTFGGTLYGTHGAQDTILMSVTNP